jgi:hypothetical protein
MPANANANVTFSFEGLAIYNLNATNNWEFLFLRHVPKHSLKINIKNNSFPNLSQSFTIAKEHDIFIEASDAIAPPNNKFRYEISGFSFDSTNEKEDIRWMEEVFEGEIGGDAPCSLNSAFPKKELTFLSINGGSVLYTKDLSEGEFEIWEKNGNTKKRLNAGTSTNQLDSRKIGVVVAAAMQYPFNKPIKIRIVGNDGFTIELPINSSDRYEINFSNHCEDSPASTQKSDFQYYYDLYSPTGKEIEIVPVPEMTILSPGVSTKTAGPAACKCTSCRSLTGSSLSGFGSN